MQRDMLTALLQPVVEELGYELWELECSPGRGNGFVRLYIDAEAGITVDDCERVSRAVSEVLDAEDPVAGQYTLEVSSPGFDRPLRTAAHFARFVARRCSWSSPSRRTDAGATLGRSRRPARRR